MARPSPRCANSRGPGTDMVDKINAALAQAAGKDPTQPTLMLEAGSVSTIEM